MFQAVTETLDSFVRHISGDGAKRARADAVDFEAMNGTRVLRGIKKTISQLKSPPSGMQIQVINALLMAMTHRFYAADYEAHKDLIWAKLGLDKTKSNRLIAVQCGRRQGKSWAMAMAAAAIILNASGMDLLVISTCDRTSKLFVELVRQFLAEIPHTAWLRPSQRGIRCRPNPLSQANDNNLIALPGCVDTLRGSTGQCLFFDEASYIEPEVITNVGFPLMQVDGTVAAFISSPADTDNNPFTRMFSLYRKDGTPVFTQTKITMICDDCVKAKLLTCVHMRHLRPRWHSEASIDDLRLIYEKHNATAFRREMAGVNESDSVFAFPEALVNAALGGETMTFSTPPSFIFVAVDPSGGGTGSSTSIVSAAFDDNDILIITEIDNFDIREALTLVQCERLVAMLNRLRRSPQLARAVFVIMIEADYNPAFTREFEKAVLQNAHTIGRAIFMRECKKTPSLPGVFKHDNGERYQRSLNVLLRTDRVRVWKHAATTEKTAELCSEQLRAFRLDIRKMHDPVRSTPLPKWSGKVAGPDDIAVTLQMLVYWATIFIASPRYAQARRAPGRLLRGMSVERFVCDMVDASLIDADAAYRTLTETHLALTNAVVGPIRTNSAFNPAALP